MCASAGTVARVPVLTEAERVGTTVGGKYRLDRIIGRGGVGTVFAGVHTWTGRDVAVKMLHVQYAEERAVVDRFLTEARAAAVLRHPNVVDVLDMGKDDDGAVYMVLEHLEGESLARRLERRKRLEPEEAAAIVLPVMDALADAHEQSIIHRDIKPENIFLAIDGKRRSVPKLLDFGIAKVLAVGSARATRTGMVIGTPAYMSPEQADGMSEVGPGADIWSIGVLLYECLTGTLPFPSESPTATLVAIMTSSAKPLRVAAPDLPVALANAVDRALSKDQSQRWPNMRAFAEAISLAVPGALERLDPSGVFHIDVPPAVVASPTPARAVAPTEMIPTTVRRAVGVTPDAAPVEPPPTSAGSRSADTSSRAAIAWGIAALLLLMVVVAGALMWSGDGATVATGGGGGTTTTAAGSAGPPSVEDPRRDSVDVQAPAPPIGVLPPPAPVVSIPTTPPPTPASTPAITRPERSTPPPAPAPTVDRPTQPAQPTAVQPSPVQTTPVQPPPVQPSPVQQPPPASRSTAPSPAPGANDSIILD